MTPRRRWTEAIVAAGAVRAAYVPDASTGRSEALEPTGAELVEGAALELHQVPLAPAPGPAISFLDGIQQWAVVGYDGVTPIVRAHVAAAVRRRGPDRRPRTADEAARELAITRLAALSAPVRRALEEADVEIVDLAADETGQPGRALRAAPLRVHPASVARATALWGGLLRERAPVSTPDARWDRLLYPIHDVETYLRSRAPRDLLPATGSRLPKTGS